MQVYSFTAEHIEKALQIARQNYEAERRFVPSLPPIGSAPDLALFAENGLGVAAFEGDKMVGFLCCVPPFENAFRSTDAVGVFSPMGANGAAADNRAAIYARMYQDAAGKWASAGASSHAICLYAHDTVSQQQFFRYGFGMRCADAIRDMNEFKAPPCPDCSFIELMPADFIKLLALDHMMDRHLAASPTFMVRKSETDEIFLTKAKKRSSRFFAAKVSEKIVAFLRIERDGETFICDMPDYIHVNGAFCLPEFRGIGIYPNLLNFAISILKAEGYTRLGVDFESINPAAYGFWLKYFDSYTHSVVRRIDEHILPILKKQH